MAKRNRRPRELQMNNKVDERFAKKKTPPAQPDPTFGNKGKPLTGETHTQRLLLHSLKHNTVIFALGPAGTGKSFLSVGDSVNRVLRDKDRKLILTRPIFEVGRSLGYTPGTEEEKYDKYIRPVKKAIRARLESDGHYEWFMKNKVEAMPLAYMLGESFENRDIVLDEAQNVTPQEMLMFLTRFGEGCRVVVNGDPYGQKYISGKSGLTDAVERLRGLPDIDIIQFTRQDIVRHDLTQKIIEAYERV